MLNSIHHTN